MELPQLVESQEDYREKVKVVLGRPHVWPASGRDRVDVHIVVRETNVKRVFRNVPVKVTNAAGPVLVQPPWVDVFLEGGPCVILPQADLFSLLTDGLLHIHPEVAVLAALCAFKKEAERLLNIWSIPPELETLPITQCAGRILAEILAAERDFPPYHRAAMDGIAVHHSDLKNKLFRRAYIDQITTLSDKYHNAKVSDAYARHLERLGEYKEAMEQVNIGLTYDKKNRRLLQLLDRLRRRR